MTKYKIFFFLFICLTNSVFCSAQASFEQEFGLDSCSKSVQFSQKALQDFTDAYNPERFFKNVDTITQMYCYAKQNNNIRLEMISLLTALNTRAEVFESPGQFYAHVNLLERCLEISEMHGFDDGLSWSYGKLTSLFTFNKMYNQAYKYAADNLLLSHENGDSVSISEAYMSIGRILREKREYNSADSILQLSLSYIPKDV